MNDFNLILQRQADAAIKQQHLMTSDNKPAQPERAATPGALLAQVRELFKVLVNAGVPKGQQLYHQVTQVMLESNWLTSHVARVDNNLTGIKWLNRPNVQHATKGTPAPEGGYYAHYPSWQAWANDYARILRINGPAGRPIDAKDATQFVAALQANHYFTDPNYRAKYNQVYAHLSDWVNKAMAQEQQVYNAWKNGQTTFTADSKKGVVPGKIYDAQAAQATANTFTAWWANQTALTKGVAIGVTALIIIEIIRR